MSRVELRRLWEGRVREYNASGQPATVWCEERKLSIHQFRYWMRQFSSRDSSSVSQSRQVRWLSVDVADSTPRVINPQRPIIVCVGECRVEVPDGFNPSALQKVVQALTELC